MKSQERIVMAINHKEPDRVPIDLNGHRSSGIMAQTYIALREELGLPKSRLYVYDFIQQLALVEDDMLDAVGADVIEIGNSAQFDPSYWKEWQLPDGIPCLIPAFIPVKRVNNDNIVYGDEGQCICIQKDGCLFYEQTYFPYMEKQDDDFSDLSHALDQIMWCKLGIPPAPLGMDDVSLAKRHENARMLRNRTNRAIYGTFGGNLIEIGEFSFRIDHFLAMLIEEPVRLHKYLDALTERHLINLEHYLVAVGDQIDVIGFGDDMGTQLGPQFSPSIYREFFKPRHTLLWNRAKQIKPHVKVSLHCCGGVYPLLPDMIEAGLDIINPVQFNCRDMELPRLKREFGNDLVFWGGGCDTRNILPYATPDIVRTHILKNLEIMAPGGGFIFQQVHNILADVPAKNITAMYNAVKEFNS